MRNMIKKHKKDWTEMPRQGTSDYDMQIWIGRLDDLAIQIESRWGVGQLEKLLQEELAIKWQRHISRINDAINNSEINVMPELFESTKRGYDALEKSVMERGFKPHGAPVCWTHPLPQGGTLAICTTHSDGAMVQANNRGAERFIIITLGEIANMVEANQLCNVVDARQESEKKPVGRLDFDFSVGDEVKF